MNWSRAILTIAVLIVLVLAASLAVMARRAAGSPGSQRGLRAGFRPRHPMTDTSGFDAIRPFVRPWSGNAPMPEIAQAWNRVGYRGVEWVNARLADPAHPVQEELPLLFMRAALMAYEGEAESAYELLNDVRTKVEFNPKSAHDLLATAVFVQGVTAMRRGENDNCIMCRGESSCIFPISPTAVHTNPTGSRLAIKHFREYLEVFPGDLGVRWLLNLAHMTLGEYPAKVDPRFRLDLDRYFRSEFDIGTFVDVSHLVGPRARQPVGGSDHG